MTKSALTIGTRGSDLALAQATATEAALRNALPQHRIERRIITTTGDRRTDVPLSQVAQSDGQLDKGVFTKELEIALAADEIDIAVHSLKDVPTVIAPEFEIVGTLPRAGIRDVLISPVPGGLDALAPGSTVGTSSVRRAMQTRWLRPDLHVTDLRGNVPTRLRKVAEGSCDAIMLAEAGLQRLGHPVAGPATLHGTTLHFTALDPAGFYPAASQGAIGLEIRRDDNHARRAVEAINDPDGFTRICAEREFLHLLDAGCHTPVGVTCHLSNHQITMAARVFPEAGGQPSTAEATGTDPIEVAQQLYRSLT